MPKVVQIVLNLAPLDALIGTVPGRAMDVLDKAAFDVEAFAKPLTNIDTGAMRNSIYVSGASGGSQYGEAVGEASGRRPGVGLVDEIKPNGKFERIVGVAVEYAYWQELIKPYLVPAVEMVRPGLTAAWSGLFKL